MNQLARRLARGIGTDGPLSIAAFMTQALHDPDQGFYASRESIGARGAFITAPEISQIFGELLGLWCAQAWHDQGRPVPARLVELGPGRGTLMHDALRALRRVPEFLSTVEVVLVESSPALEALQRERLRDVEACLRWVRQWNDIVHDRPPFVLANEFLDAMPIRQFAMTDRGWCERMVTTDAAGTLVFALAPVPARFAVPPTRGTAEFGAIYEVSPAAEALAEDMGRIIATRGGAAVFIDYGHQGRGFGDTLQAVSGHAAADVLAAPGEADLSAHVDFAALAWSVKKSGARVHGPIAQGGFLRALGIDARATRLAAANPDRAAEIAASVHRLADAQRMGALFKVLAVAPRAARALPGFERC